MTAKDKQPMDESQSQQPVDETSDATTAQRSSGDTRKSGTTSTGTSAAKSGDTR